MNTYSDPSLALYNLPHHQLETRSESAARRRRNEDVWWFNRSTGASFSTATAWVRRARLCGFDTLLPLAFQRSHAPHPVYVRVLCVLRCVVYCVVRERASHLRRNPMGFDRVVSPYRGTHVTVKSLAVLAGHSPVPLQC